MKWIRKRFRKTIKNCVVFFTVMTIIGMVVGAIMAIVALSKLF